MATVVDEETGETTETGDEPETPEVETPEVETPDEPKPEPEPEPDTPPLSEKEIEAVFKKLEKNATANANAISRILGEEAQDLIHCALCAPATPGFYFAANLDDEVRANVLAAISAPDETQFATDPDARECDLCNGYGETLTGSKVASQLTKPCPKCKANGWTTEQQRIEWSATQGARQVVEQIGERHEDSPAPTTTMPPNDAWQRPLGHEFYGKNPVYMTAEERARDVIA